MSRIVVVVAAMSGPGTQSWYGPMVDDEIPLPDPLDISDGNDVGNGWPTIVVVGTIPFANPRVSSSP
jgi:hypothetical protein